jgi:hypothetical protein
VKRSLGSWRRVSLLVNEGTCWTSPSDEGHTRRYCSSSVASASRLNHDQYLLEHVTIEWTDLRNWGSEKERRWRDAETPMGDG